MAEIPEALISRGHVGCFLCLNMKFFVWSRLVLTAVTTCIAGPYEVPFSQIGMTLYGL